MIDTNEAFNLFCKKYSEKYKNQNCPNCGAKMEGE